MGIPVRACIAVQIFFGSFILYMLRVLISINILAMVETEDKYYTSECIPKDDNATQEPFHDYGTRYSWTRAQQGYVLAAYSYGYVISSAPGGYLADRFGAKIVVLVSTVCAAVITCFIPLGAKIDVWAVVVMQFLIGLTSGGVFPALQSLIARWAPPDERGRFIAALLGNTLGIMMTWPFLGVVITSMGWIWAFVIPGVFALLWSVSWYFTVADTPSEHKFISDDECDYLRFRLGDGVKGAKRTPLYRFMVKNPAFYALLVAQFGNLWGLYLLLNHGPMYMNEVLGYTLRKSGMMAVIPYVARMTFGIIFGNIGDRVKKKEIMSVTKMRKFFTIFSHLIPGFLLYTVLLAGCSHAVAITLIALSMGFNGSSAITSLQNCQDVAPQFAGTIYGFMNLFGSTTGFITPAVTAFITKDQSGVREWNIIFAIAGTVYIVCGGVFILFSSGEKQDFNTAQMQPYEP